MLYSRYAQTHGTSCMHGCPAPGYDTDHGIVTAIHICVGVSAFNHIFFGKDFENRSLEACRHVEFLIT